MQIASGTTCTRGLKLRLHKHKGREVIDPPQSGKVEIKRPILLVYRKS